MSVPETTADANAPQSNRAALLIVFLVVFIDLLGFGIADRQSYVGFITDSILAREVVAKGLDPNTTLVKTCMRTPVVAIEGDRPIIDAVRMMKEQATRHLAVTQDGAIIGVISVSNVLRYYSGVV